MIEGANIVDIASFYLEVNRVFMANEDWQLGETLDGLNDMLYGGYGALAGSGPVEILWRDMDASRAALGASATSAFLEQRRSLRSQFNGQPIEDQISALAAGRGKTYFDIVMDIFADHPRIALRSV
ncbi:ribonuclease inhibitor [Sphingobium sp. WCS2017Hpa-17]|uniref:ribonuclease inhibitor n=1 Tax=Sphingobium sp. WCS2017Hpa-17 TaxID=3073638 RepID=UPI00288BB667|nr:ribonuclease inhibitor [Sphingobium sp. WCS2017Hpa-17]